MPSEGFIFPLKALIDSKAPKADRLEDQVIPQTPKAVPLESSLHPPQDEYEYEPGTPLPADSDVEPDAPQEPVFPDLKLTPKGEIIPDGFHWDGHRIVRNYKGSKRPAGIDSELWKMLGPQDRKADHRGRSQESSQAAGGKASTIIWQQGQKEEIFTSPA